MADNMGVNAIPLNPNDFPNYARRVVYRQIEENLEKTDGPINFSVYVVWFTYILGNWKAMVSSSLPDGRYYEVTFNDRTNEVYVDTYVKIQNTSRKIYEDEVQ